MSGARGRGGAKREHEEEGQDEERRSYEERANTGGNTVRQTSGDMLPRQRTETGRLVVGQQGRLRRTAALQQHVVRRRRPGSEGPSRMKCDVCWGASHKAESKLISVGPIVHATAQICHVLAL